MSELLFIAVIFATWNAVLIWRRSPLFARARANAEVWESESDWFVLFLLGKLLGCFWCLSVWVATILVVGCHFFTPIAWITYGLAASQFATLLESMYQHDPDQDDPRDPPGNREGSGPDLHPGEDRPDQPPSP